jgi:hypothetical protein
LTLLWKRHYVPMILSGEKTATRRRKRPAVKVGGAYNVKIGFFNHLSERIHVDALYQQRLGDMTDEDAVKEGANSLQAYAEEWKTLTGSWNPDEVVWVVEFHLEATGG